MEAAAQPNDVRFSYAVTHWALIYDSQGKTAQAAPIWERSLSIPEPARTVCALAAFMGFTRSELMGLKWNGYDGESKSLRRKIWNGKEGAPKTKAREAGVYLMPLLRGISKNYRKAYPAGKEGWMSRGEKLLRPIHLDNLSRAIFPSISMEPGSDGTRFEGDSAHV